MMIAIDGACRRNGQPTCSSAGVAWIQTEAGELLYRSRCETKSTNQRGEIFGLIEALTYAAENTTESEDIIIITDSEYLYNTVMLDWVSKWQRQNWYGASGPVKNPDLWQEVYSLLKKINIDEQHVFMEWTKGHLMSYSAGNINKAMAADQSGIELFTRIQSVATRPSERDRIIKEFLRERSVHDKVLPPDETALEWVIANTTADCLAVYVVKIMDNVLV